MKKILIFLKVLQVKQSESITKHKHYRFNPYNPLSYLFIPLLWVTAIVMVGIIGFIERLENPFKYN